MSDCFYCHKPADEVLSYGGPFVVVCHSRCDPGLIAMVEAAAAKPTGFGPRFAYVEPSPCVMPVRPSTPLLPPPEKPSWWRAFLNWIYSL